MIPRVRPIVDTLLARTAAVAAAGLDLVSAALDALAFRLKADAGFRRRLLDRHRRHLLAGAARKPLETKAPA